MRCVVLVLVRVLFVAALLGCVTVQDLGSHAQLPEGGAGDIDASPPAEGGIVIPEDSGHPGKIFFVTDGQFTGALSGLQGADQLCTKEARSAGLGGVFKAWLSTSSENAKSRIAAVGPWRSVGGTIVPFPAASVVGTPKDFPRYTAKGNDLFFTNEPNVWTGTKADGTVNTNGDTCAGWTSSVANVKRSDPSAATTSAEL